MAVSGLLRDTVFRLLLDVNVRARARSLALCTKPTAKRGMHKCVCYMPSIRSSDQLDEPKKDKH